jgi:hypothetical protein
MLLLAEGQTGDTLELSTSSDVFDIVEEWI